MKRELLNNTVIKPLVLPTVTPLSAGTTSGLWIDRANFISAVVGLATGAVTGAPSAQSVTVTLKTSNDSDGTGAVDLKDMEGNAVTLALTTGSAVIDKDVDLLGAKKYIGVSVVTAFTGGTTPAVPVNLFVALGDPQDTRNI